jgi:hypothetical protein
MKEGPDRGDRDLLGVRAGSSEFGDRAGAGWSGGSPGSTCSYGCLLHLHRLAPGEPVLHLDGLRPGKRRT